MFQPKTIVAVAEHTEMTPERWQQITGMFHVALLRNSGQRRTFLEDACGADAALRAEVEAMLAAHDNAGEPGSIPAVAVSEEMLRLQSGSAVGRYRIDALIGAGGMGQVYRARDPRIEAMWRSRCCRGRGRSASHLVPQVDRDGNDLGGIRDPEVAVTAGDDHRLEFPRSAETIGSLRLGAPRSSIKSVFSPSSALPSRLRASRLDPNVVLRVE